MHGYSIMKNLEEDLGVRLSPRLLYPVLRRIVEMDLATARENAIGNRRIVVYEISQSRHEYLKKYRGIIEEFDKKAERI